MIDAITNQEVGYVINAPIVAVTRVSIGVIGILRWATRHRTEKRSDATSGCLGRLVTFFRQWIEY